MISEGSCDTETAGVTTLSFIIAGIGLNYILKYVNIRAVKINALTQIHFNGTNFINVRLTQRAFSVWPVA